MFIDGETHFCIKGIEPVVKYLNTERLTYGSLGIQIFYFYFNYPVVMKLIAKLLTYGS